MLTWATNTRTVVESPHKNQIQNILEPIIQVDPLVYNSVHDRQTELTGIQTHQRGTQLI